jgi:spore coat polysaccharide biosynthesis protein SpsF (cytidylyltransferase family)
VRTVAVIQARTGSTRLPGKVLEPIGGLPLIAWTIAAVSAVPGVDAIVLATTDSPGDDPLAEMIERRGDMLLHRGSTHDVLGRVWGAISPLEPDIVIRQTGDNPFADPDIMAAQFRHLIDAGLDYVGIAGLPYGIGAEVVRIEALRAAHEEATEAADREHVLPYVYGQPERFRVGALEEPPPWHHSRYTVDTEADLALARALADRWGAGPPTRLADLEAIVAAEPGLAALNAKIPQRDRTHAQQPLVAKSENA